MAIVNTTVPITSALCEQMILQLVEKMEINPSYFVGKVEEALQKRVKVQGGSLYVGQDLNKVFRC